MNGLDLTCVYSGKSIHIFRVSTFISIIVLMGKRQLSLWEGVVVSFLASWFLMMVVVGFFWCGKLLDVFPVVGSLIS